MPHRAGGELFVADVVFDVRCRDDHRVRSGMAENRALQCWDAGRVDMLDDLHKNDCVGPGEPIVAIGQRRLQQLEPGSLAVAVVKSTQVVVETPGGIS